MSWEVGADQDIYKLQSLYIPVLNATPGGGGGGGGGGGVAANLQTRGEGV